MLAILFLVSLGFGSEPIDKAVDAAYIQSGLKGDSDAFFLYMNNNYINKSPFLRTSSGLFLVYRNRCAKFEFRNVRTEVGLDSAKVELVIGL